jgi:hypothetical protein
LSSSIRLLTVIEPVQNISASAAALNSDGSNLAVVVASPTIPGGNQVTLYDSQFNVLGTQQLNADVVSRDRLNLVAAVGLEPTTYGL